MTPGEATAFSIALKALGEIAGCSGPTGVRARLALTEIQALVSRMRLDATVIIQEGLPADPPIKKAPHLRIVK